MEFGNLANRNQDTEGIINKVWDAVISWFSVKNLMKKIPWLLEEIFYFKNIYLFIQQKSFKKKQD